MKERLLGAAVLVVAAVLIVPMLLDGPGQDTSQVTRELELPAPESTPARTHVVELQTRDSGSAPDTPSEPAQPFAEPAVSVPADTSESSESSSSPISTESTESAGEPQAAAPPRAAPPPDTPDAPQPGWAVQVGSFTSEPNARRLAGLLQASDYPAFVTRSVVQGRVMYRVRVGPEPDRAGAEMLAERLRADRQSTQIVQHP